MASRIAWRSETGAWMIRPEIRGRIGVGKGGFADDEDEDPDDDDEEEEDDEDDDAVEDGMAEHM